MKKQNWIITGSLAILASLLLVSCSGITIGGSPEPTPLPTVTLSAAVMAEGRVVPKDYAVLMSPVAAKIDKINVAEGDRVVKDTVLVSLGSREQVQAALDQAKLAQLSAQQQMDKLIRTADFSTAQALQELSAAKVAVAEAQNAFDKVNTEDFLNQIDDKDIAVQDAQDTLKEKQDTLDKYLDLAVDNPTRKNAQAAVDDALVALHKAERERDLLQSELDQAKATLDLAQARLKEAQYILDVRSKGPDKDALDLAQAKLDGANGQLTAAQSALDQMDLKAPYNGTVMEIRNLEVGEAVIPGQTLITFADTDAWYVETKDLTELDVVKVQVGQKVSITLDSWPNVQLAGEVESISNVYIEKSNDVLYTVRIHLDNPDPQLRWGMTANVSFPE